jgi:hypothetical protein
VFFNTNGFGQKKDSLRQNEKTIQSISVCTIDSLYRLLSVQQNMIEELKGEIPTRKESPAYPFWGYVLAFLGALITAGVSYRVGTNQGKSNLNIKRIDILSYDKAKLTDLKKEIIGHMLNLPKNQTITHEQMGSSAIDSIIFKILEVLKISEYFEVNFINRIREYNDTLQNFMGTAKLGQPVDEAKASETVGQMKDIEKLIVENIDSEIKKRQLNIEELL